MSGLESPRSKEISSTRYNFSPSRGIPDTARPRGLWSSSSSTTSIKLRTSDDKDFSVPQSVLVHSQTINGMIEDGCASGVIPLPNVHSDTLEKVIKYCTKHTDESVSAKELKEFDAEFIDPLSTDDLYYLLLASNYLDIQSLLHAMAEKAASMMRGKTPEQIREIFGIENDFTKEEEEMKKKNPWSFE